MDRNQDVLTVAIKAGQNIFLAADATGEPARTLAVGTAAAVIALGTGIAFGSYKYGSKAIDLLVK